MNVNPTDGLKLSAQQIIDSRIALSYFGDIGIVQAVNGNFVDVEHAVYDNLPDGSLTTNPTMTHNVELLFPMSASYSETWPVAVGDLVLLIGLRRYVRTVSGLTKAQAAPAFSSYQQNNMKALPLTNGLSAKVAVKVDSSGNYSLTNTNSSGNVQLIAQNGLFQVKNNTASLYTVINNLLTALTTFSTGLTPVTLVAQSAALVSAIVPIVTALSALLEA